jgi:hypothetical protein
VGNVKELGRRGEDQWLFEKIKVFFKNQKHEPKIVEITHMCIMHGLTLVKRYGEVSVMEI